MAARGGGVPSSAVAEEADIFLSEVVDTNPGYNDVERIFEARSRLHALQSLQNCLYDFVRHSAGMPASSSHCLGPNLVASLHLLLTMLVHASQAGDPDDRVLLERLTSNRSDMLDGIRKRMAGESATAAVRESLLVATMLFERAVWLIRDLEKWG